MLYTLNLAQDCRSTILQSNNNNNKTNKQTDQ